LSNVLKLGKETLIYGLGQTINKLLGVVTLPLLTLYLAKDQLGQLDLLSTSQSLLATILMLGLDTAVTFYFWEHKDREDQQKTYIATAFQFSLGMGLLGGVGLWMVLTLPGFDSGLPWEVKCIAALHIPNMITYLLLAKLYRVFRKPALFITQMIGVSVLNVALLFVFLYGLKWGLVAVVLSQFLVFAVANVATAIYFRHYLFRMPARKALGQLLAYGSPLIAMSIANQLVAAVQRPVLLLNWDVATVGAFSVANRIASAVAVVTGAFAMAWGPFSMSIKHEPDAAKTYGNIAGLYYWLGLFVALGVQALSPLLVSLLASTGYSEIVAVVPLLSLGMIIQALYGVHAVGLNITKKTYLVSVGVVISLVLSTAFTWWLTPLWGLAGAAAAMLIAYFCTNLFIVALGKRFYPIPYDLGSLAVVLLAFVPLFGLGLWSQLRDPSFQLWHLLLPVAFLAAFAMKERKRVTSLLSRFSRG